MADKYETLLRKAYRNKNLVLYLALYSPPNHRDGVVHHTRVEAEKDNEHFDDKTTE